MHLADHRAARRRVEDTQRRLRVDPGRDGKLQALAGRDHVRGRKQVVDELGRKDNNIGFILPNMGKSAFFKTVIFDGALPRKTFSMGEANEKRYYLECRKISK